MTSARTDRNWVDTVVKCLFVAIVSVLCLIVMAFVWKAAGFQASSIVERIARIVATLAVGAGVAAICLSDYHWK